MLIQNAIFNDKNAKINNTQLAMFLEKGHDVVSPNLKIPKNEPTMNITNFHNHMLLREV